MNELDQSSFSINSKKMQILKNNKIGLSRRYNDNSQEDSYNNMNNSVEFEEPAQIKIDLNTYKKK